MNNLAIIICNWNKREDVLRCLDSVSSSVPSFTQVFVVDNASTDGSVEALEAYDKIPFRLIKNNKNLGSSGGFNTGLRESLDKKYKYVHLLDNDVIVNKDTFYNAYELLENEPDIGAVGSKLYQFDEPEKLQEMGAFVDWEKCQINPQYAGVSDSSSILNLVECDYVPACSVMIRTDLVRKIGSFDESFFLYWDDIEWFHRLRQTGHKVVCCGKSKAWHKMGVKIKNNTAGTYYFQRNRVRFFLKYSKKEDLESTVQTIFNDLFESYYFSRLEAKFNTAKTVLHSIKDALQGIDGMASEKRIKKCDQPLEKFKCWVRNQEKIVLEYDCSQNTRLSVLSVIKSVNPNAKILAKEYSKTHNPDILSKSELSFKVCRVLDHVSNLSRKEMFDEFCYVDRFCNFIDSPTDRKQIINYKKRLHIAQKKFFNKILKDAMNFRRKSWAKIPIS
jgi:GT2 family glycosyltransferase